MPQMTLQAADDRIVSNGPEDFFPKGHWVVDQFEILFLYGLRGPFRWRLPIQLDVKIFIA